MVYKRFQNKHPGGHILLLALGSEACRDIQEIGEEERCHVTAIL